jgi:thiol-disulfide isomerase/thioredoxin
LTKERKNRWLKVALAIALFSIAVGSDSSMNGKPAPAVSFQNLDGQTVNLAQYRGKVVLVNFWATWCEPCRWEIPKLIEFQKEYGNRGFTVLGVTMDEQGKAVVAPFVAKPQFDVDGRTMAMNYPVVIGNDTAATKFGISAFPTSFVISKDGKIVKKVVGVVDGQGINRLIQRQL